jgi:thiol-disulfide isomerase/thioredoxin
MQRTRDEKLREQALGALMRDQVENPKVGADCLKLADLPLPGIDKFLQAVAAKNPEPAAKGLASLALAGQALAKAGELEGAEATKLEKDAEKQLKEVVAKYGDVQIEGGTVGGKANAWLGLIVGNVAPDITGEDVESKKFKLSDYRGKVVMIDFWAGWCPPCMGLVPHNRALVKKLEGKPFALLGVNADNSREDFKKVSEKNQINWRSFFDDGGKISSDWRIQGFPTMLVLDHKGVLRFKIVGGGEENAKAVDEMVEKLLKEAEADSSKKGE